jgi:hypothetical protein
MYAHHLPDDCITENNPIRAIEVFVDGLDLLKLGFEGMQPQAIFLTQHCSRAK